MTPLFERTMMLNEVLKLVVRKVAKSFLAGKLYENNDDPQRV